MLRWALGFLMVALAAAIVGFGGIAPEYAALGRATFLVFLTFFVGSLLTSAVSTRNDDRDREDKLTSD